MDFMNKYKTSQKKNNIYIVVFQKKKAWILGLNFLMSTSGDSLLIFPTNNSFQNIQMCRPLPNIDSSIQMKNVKQCKIF
jgi:hypothetical protein